MFKAWNESQRRNGPWHVAVLLMLGIGVGIIGLYYLLSKNLIYCPIGDSNLAFSPTYSDRGVLSEVGGLKFWLPANYAQFEQNQKSGTHPWLVLQGLLPGLRPLTKKLGIVERDKLDDCDFYVRDKVVVALVQKKPKPYWADRGGINSLSLKMVLQGTQELDGPHGLKEIHLMALKEGYSTNPFPQSWMYSHTYPDKRRIFLYCWRDKLGGRGCYSRAAPLDFTPETKASGVSMKYYFNYSDLARWREIDKEARALVRVFYEAGQARH